MPSKNKPKVFKEMNKQQLRTIESLAKAVKRCSKVGLSLFGCDNNLIAIRTEEADYITNNMTEPGVGDWANSISAITIDDEDAVYLDSGGA